MKELLVLRSIMTRLLQDRETEGKKDKNANGR